MRFLLGIGDSHLKSLTAAWQEFEALNPGMIQYTTISARNKDLAPWFLSQNGIDSPNPLWVSAIRCALRGADALVVLCLAGNRDWAWGLTAGPNPFDFIDPDNDIDTEPMGQLIPYDLFMTKARSEYGAIRMVANTVRQVSDARVVHVAPPPPIRRLAAMFAVRPDMNHIVSDYGVSPGRYRLKVWRACVRALTEVCDELRIEVIMPPAKALDPDGYLAEGYIGDVIHGNIAWGRLHIESIMDSRQADRK